MGMWCFDLYGHDTTERISVGYGPRPLRYWDLQRFPGPSLWTDCLGLSERKLVFLPPDLLQLLYERFRVANPSGLSVGEMNELEARFSQGMTPAQRDALYEQRKFFVNITGTDEERGYPHLRRYLPEVFDLSRLCEIAADPWLDAHLLGTVAPTLPLGTEAGGQVDAYGYRVVSPQGRSERWWPQWRAYCDALGSTQGAGGGAHVVR